MYSKEVERANLDISDDFKLKKPSALHDLCKKHFSVHLTL